MAQEQVHGSDSVILSRSGGDPLSLPLVPATEGAPGADISKLLSTAGLVTYDPGFANTASCTSTITYIDGDAGILRYRGYPIDAARRAARRFLEVSYLLIYGELPTRRQLAEFTEQIQPAHAAARGPQAVLRRLPARRAPDAGAVLGGVRAVDLLPGLARPVRRRAGRAVHDPAARQAADDRGVRVQEVDRPAVPLPRQLARPGRELPADDVRVPGRAVRGRPGGRRARWTCCSSCTPTTSRTARPRRCGWSARRRRTCSPRSRPASTRCAGRCTAARTRPSSRCSRRSRPTAATSTHVRTAR